MNRGRRIAGAIRWAALITIGATALAGLSAESRAGNRIAVIPFGKVLGQTPIGDPNRPIRGSMTLDPVATAELRAELSKIPYVTLVDQSLVESKLGQTQPHAAGAPPEPGGWGTLFAADWIVTGDFTYTTSKDYTEETEYTNSGRERTVRVPMVTINTSMSIQMTDATTGTAHNHLATAKKIIKGRGAVGSREQEAAVRETFTQAARQLAQDIAGHIDFSGTVLSVERTAEKKSKTILVIGLGRPSGVQKGMEFTIARSGGTVTDPATGQQKALPERLIGKCRVTEPGSETSYAELKSGEAAVGDRVTLSR